MEEEPNFCVELNPIYNVKFFDLLKKIMKASPCKISEISLRQIYEILLDINLLKGMDNLPISLHVEVLLPWLDWPQAWGCLWLKGIGGEAVSTMYRVLHNILPMRERINRISRNYQSGGFCSYCPNVKDDICHAITQCVKSVEAANLMLQLIQKIHPPTIIGDVLFLQ